MSVMNVSVCRMKKIVKKRGKKRKGKSKFQDKDSGMAICGLGGSEDVSWMEL